MREASERLGHLSEATLYRLAREGHLPVRRIGRKILISDIRLDEWANGIGDVRHATPTRSPGPSPADRCDAPNENAVTRETSREISIHGRPYGKSRRYQATTGD